MQKIVKIHVCEINQATYDFGTYHYSLWAKRKWAKAFADYIGTVIPVLSSH